MSNTEQGGGLVPLPSVEMVEQWIHAWVGMEYLGSSDLAHHIHAELKKTAYDGNDDDDWNHRTEHGDRVPGCRYCEEPP